MNIKAKIYTRTNGSNTHYARVILPKELRAFVAKAAVWRTLATKIDAEAHKAGIVTATATKLVFQEVCDTHLKNENEKVVVVIDVELVGVKIDMEAIKEEVDPEELVAIAESLRSSFNIPSKGSVLPGKKPSGGSTNKPTPSAKARSRKADKVAEKKSAAGESILMIQTEPAPPIDGDVAQYIEKRPHGYFRFRYWIPRPLQNLIGQREVRHTLRTKDRAAAIERAVPMFIEVREKLQRLQEVNCSA